MPRRCRPACTRVMATAATVTVHTAGAARSPTASAAMPMPLRMIQPSLAGRVTPGEMAERLGSFLVASEAGVFVDVAAVMPGADVAGVTVARVLVRRERVRKARTLLEPDL